MGQVRIRVMESRDFAYAVKLTDMAEWDFTAEEFAWMKSLEPEGCFIALVDHERAGLATAISYGEIGWMGNIIVHPGFRSQGVGTELVQACISYLQSHGAGKLGLYSYGETVPFYERLGFTGDIKFTRLSADLEETRPAKTPRMNEEHLKQAITLDERYFGAHRGRLLEAIYRTGVNPSVCYASLKADTLLGFVMGRITGSSTEVGPLVCPPEAHGEAEQLVAAALSNLAGKHVCLGISQRSPQLYRSLRALGFREDFRVLRMWLGGESPKAEEASYRLMESLERG